MNKLLEVKNVVKKFNTGGLFSNKKLTAVNDVSFTLDKNKPEIFTIIGESGSGKTTLARMILGLETTTHGEILHEGKRVDGNANRSTRMNFMRSVQPVFQNPFEAFNPLKKIDQYLVSTTKELLQIEDDEEVKTIIDDNLQKVGLSHAEIMGRYPHELSGGQLQRTAIARALICNPSLLVADEPVSMVDASLKMSIVNLLQSLRDDFGVNVIYITHDLATAYYISDRIIIMQKGLVVEMGPARPILDDPKHPYSQLLKASVLSIADAGNGQLAPATDLIEIVNRNEGQIGKMRTYEDTRQVREYS
ncbi:MAG: ABC transporter ATP-binding protein [Hyphomicrobiales bacterium]|nr:MAG: ABC transporter ATP-binding protein [Hyphomicrobiales bacterium]